MKAHELMKLDSELMSFLAAMPDGMGFPRKSKFSVDVTRQDSGTLGRTDLDGDLPIGVARLLLGDLDGDRRADLVHLPNAACRDEMR